ncbi:hypothetical protein FIBSPDRAFT_1037789 [Athelia psychrophila]|uniref:DRBM domain-containing protein n=1 Tax=Athelia psychrophila TaxID=1759441 RepID=A0A166U5R2_9AGAM|nr:hypothetical protein FIBSPDRAFT_1037789 [Fibularhizoctonia sp. CBS 109695]
MATNSTSSSSRVHSRSKGGSFGGSSRAPPPSFKGGINKGKKNGLPVLEGPPRDEAYIASQFAESYAGVPPPKPVYLSNPKGSLSNWAHNAYNKLPMYQASEGRALWRTTVSIPAPAGTDIIGTGDHRIRKESERLAALAALYEIQGMGLLDKAATLREHAVKGEAATSISITLSDGSAVDYERARQFIDYYCRRYKFGKPVVDFQETRKCWEAIMTVGGRRIGMGTASNKKNSQTACYLDVTQYLETCDADLWKAFVAAATSK